jgi:hypothetical protein
LTRITIQLNATLEISIQTYGCSECLFTSVPTPPLESAYCS